jgi:hypothetical protein
MDDESGGDAAVLGPAPLVRTDNKNQLRLQQEGLDVLRQARSPVRIVFAIGGSRCGKSTASNALAFGPDTEAPGFQTGDSFDPVTEGVDVAARQLPNGGTLIVADCEGAFHACGSAHSARGFGTLGLFAYRMSTALLHVSMGSIDERDIEAIGFLAAHGCSPVEASGEAKEPEAEDSEAPALPDMPPGSAPTLCLLVNGARFELTDAVARRLLAVSEDLGAEAGRNSARMAIAHGFRNAPVLEALPACGNAAYWPRVATLRRRILDTSPVKAPSGLAASGADIVHLVSDLVSGLNGEAPSAVLAREPQAATEAFYRSMHLDPLVEELSRRFAATGAATDQRSALGSLKTEAPASPTKCAFEEMLAEFDRRTAWMSGKASEDPKEGAPLLRCDVLLDMRGRLAARLNGIREALARGRQQGAQARPTRRGRPPSLGGSSVSASDWDKENATPPGTPAGCKKSLRILEAAVREVEAQLDELLTQSDRELSELRAVFSMARDEVLQATRSSEEADAQAVADVQSLQDRFHGRLRELTEARARGFKAQVTECGAIATDLDGEVLALGEQLHDLVGQCSSQIADARNTLEAQRLQRQEASNVAARTVEDFLQETQAPHLQGRLKALREEVSSEAGAAAQLREVSSKRWEVAIQSINEFLEDERQERVSRHKGLAEVVDRLRVSLEATAEANDPVVSQNLFRTPLSPVRTTGFANTPAAPTSLPTSLQEANRTSRTPLRSGSSLTAITTPLNTSGCSGSIGTPTRSLPAPPVHS